MKDQQNQAEFEVADSNEPLGAVIAVLMTCHNRCSSTLLSLEALFAQVVPNVALEVVLVDDGSQDGTDRAVRERFPQVRIVKGEGNLYWAAGMALAERHAAALSPAFFLWLNDDTQLRTGALQDLLEVARKFPDAIVVGATVNPVAGGTMSYGGRVRSGRHPLKFTLVEPRGEVTIVDAFNGNCVLIPRSVHERVGLIDGEYEHAFADDDYSLRAVSVGVSAVQAPEYVGWCSPGFIDQTGLIGALRRANSPKGLPSKSLSRFLRRHLGGQWFVYWIRAKLGFIWRHWDRRSI